MSEYERPDRAVREPTVEDVRQLMGASTPHFALQIRNRIQNLVAGFRRITRRAWRASARSHGSSSWPGARSGAGPIQAHERGLPSFPGD